MIEGTRVRCRREIRVKYGTKPDDVVPAGSEGVVSYIPNDGDDDAIGVAWFDSCGDILHVVEVNTSEVERLDS